MFLVFDGLVEEGLQKQQQRRAAARLKPVCLLQVVILHTHMKELIPIMSTVIFSCILMLF